MRAPTFLLVALMKKIASTRDSDVENLGVGNVGKSFAVNTMTRLQEINYRQQKTIMMPFVVGMNRGFQKKPIVLADAQVIA